MQARSQRMGFPWLCLQAPTSYSLIVNLRTAKALDLTIPWPILAAANEVIE